MDVASPSLLADLHALLPRDRVLTDPAELLVYECDGFTIARAVPGAVVFPTSTEEVVAIVKRLAALGVQIVPRGSGTGLAGGCVAFDILKIDPANRVAHVEAGVRNTALTDALAAAGLPGFHFAPDPSSQRVSTIGGNAATNAGGIHILKDFSSAHHVLGMEMVLADVLKEIDRIEIGRAS